MIASRRAVLWSIGCVALVAAGIYAGTLGHALVWDDHSLLRRVEDVAARGGPGALLRSEFLFRAGERTGYYRPVVLLSLWLDARLAAFLPASFHLTNVLLHTAASILLLLLLLQAAWARAPGGAMGLVAGPLAGALLFAVHPVHVEAVAFVSGRTDLWAAVFVLLSAVLWMRRQPDGSSTRWAYPGSLAALLLGVLSKEVAAMLPAVLLAWDALRPVAPDGWWRRNRRWLAGWAAVGIAAAALRWGLAAVPFGADPAQGGGDVLALHTRPSLITGAVLLYLRLLVVPWPQSAYYRASDLAPGLLTVASAVLLVGASLLLARRRDGRAGLLGLAWILGFLVPVLGVVPLRAAPVAERFLYLPSAGAALVVAALVARLALGPPGRRLAVTGAAVAIAGFGAATVARSAVWRDGASLFEDLARSSPEYVARAKSNLGVELQSAGRHAEAVELLRQALALDPDVPEIHSNLATSLLELGRTPEAERHYREALGMRPGLIPARFGLGLALARQGRLAEAAQQIEPLRGAPALAAALTAEIEAARRAAAGPAP